jgi:ElaB/YqjD/DUF883 family membrane-anchored ribosome-binding protein
MMFNDKPGYLDKDDIIRAQAADIDRLRAEIREHIYVKEMHREHIDKLLKEQMEGYKGPSFVDVIDAVARTGAHEAGYWVTRAWAHLSIASIAGIFIGFLIGHYTK